MKRAPTNRAQAGVRSGSGGGVTLVPILRRGGGRTGREPAPGRPGRRPLQWTNFPSIIRPWTNRDAVRRIKVRLLVKGDPEENIPNYELTTDISPRNLGV